MPSVHRHRWWSAALVLLVMVVAMPAGAQQRTERARQAFYEGKKAYEAGDFPRAYDFFKQSYMLSQEPALLYNISAVLQGMGRAGDAAQALRDYLRLVPADPDRSTIEQRIAALDNAQKLLDRDSAIKKPPPPSTVDAAQLEAAKAEAERLRAEQATRDAETKRQLELMRKEMANRDNELVSRLDQQREVEKKKRRNLAIGLSVGGIVLVGAAVGIALALTQQPAEKHTPADLGPFTATP